MITTSLSFLTGIMVNKGNHPQMAQRFSLVNYYNLPIYIHMYIYMYIYICMYICI